MKLIIFKDLHTKYLYADKLIGNLPFTVSEHRVGRTVMLLTLESSNLDRLRGCAFDEVLWVGYNEITKVGQAPLELLAQLSLSNPKHHYLDLP